MAAFFRIRQAAVVFAIEGYARIFDKDLIDEAASFFGENACGAVEAGAGTRRDNVLNELFGRVLRAERHNSTLGVARIALTWCSRAGDQKNLAFAILCELERGSRAANPATGYQHIDVRVHGVVLDLKRNPPDHCDRKATC